MNEKGTTVALNRLRRIEGQVRGIQRMMSDGRYCVDILIQTSAVISALHRVEDEVLRGHLSHCVADALGEGDPRQKTQKIGELMLLISKFRRPEVNGGENESSPYHPEVLGSCGCSTAG